MDIERRRDEDDGWKKGASEGKRIRREGLLFKWGAEGGGYRKISG